MPTDGADADKSVARDIEQDAHAGRRCTIGHWVVEVKKTEGKFDVFLSHHSKEHKEVEKIAEELKEADLRPWVGYEWLVPRTSWVDALFPLGVDSLPVGRVFPARRHAANLRQVAVRQDDQGGERSYPGKCVIGPDTYSQ